MHIPDGYLSPSTCAVLYAVAAPFWRVAIRRVRASLDSRTVPMLSLVAAFTFVLMMFNLPLPGGTTGHAIGIGVAVVIVGPWGAVVAISVALAIQALFFGDGGILTLGANCFNIAVVAPLVAHAVHRVAARGAAPAGRRRALAAGLAGYAGINAAALLTAIELGLQPALFADASGTPLYSPYGISIALPAVMIGHLALAGVAEASISAGVVAWLQRSNPTLLDWPAPSACAPERRHRFSMRPFWTRLAIVMLATPLGLLSAGTAWGEWSANDFATGSGRDAIAAASGNVAPPESAPRGLARLSTFWIAPVPDYAPPFLRSETLGYALSAMFGTGLVMLAIAPLARRSRKCAISITGAEEE